MVDYRSKKQRLSGFTLAEVLITLGIIGIVASLTIPVLRDKFEKQATVEGYKKAYSTLSNAVKMSEAENGTIDGWDFPDTFTDYNQGVQFMNTYLLPYLNVSKKCELNTNCFIKPKRPDGGSTDVNFPIQYILNDGTAIEVSCLTHYNGIGLISLYVDINGFKNPNTMGKDVFLFDIFQKDSILYNAGNGNLAQNVKSGGVYPDGFGLNIKGNHYQYRGCGRDVTFNRAGSYCGMKIIQDGYQIKEDYPW